MTKSLLSMVRDTQYNADGLNSRSCWEKKGEHKFTEYANKPKVLKLRFHTGCQASGVYGASCKELCPTNCRDNVCHIQKGTCYGCAPGWTYTACNTSRITLTLN